MQLFEMLSAAATKVGLSDEKVFDENPWDSNDPALDSLKQSMMDLFPAESALLQQQGKAGRKLSVAAKMALAGKKEFTQDTYQEAIELDPGFKQKQDQRQQQWEADMLAAMESKALEMSRARGVNPDAAPAFGGGISGRMAQVQYEQQQQLNR